MRQIERASRSTVPYTGSTACQRSAPGCEPPEVVKRGPVTFPSPQPPVPAVVRRLADGRPVRAVWVNEEGGVTFRLGSGGSGRDFVKVANARGTDFAAEAPRLRWAARYVAVP